MVEILALLEILHSLRRDENVLFRETPIRKFWTDTELGQSLIPPPTRLGETALPNERRVAESLSSQKPQQRQKQQQRQP